VEVEVAVAPVLAVLVVLVLLLFNTQNKEVK
jgi:hypothetical protein